MSIGRRRIGLIAASAALLASGPFLVGATSGGTASKRVAVTCGQTVTASITLTADVTGCSGYGIVAGHSGITIDLGGHRVSGSGSTHDGLYDASYTGVVFKNGTVSNFVRGIEIDGGSATIQALRVTNNSDAGIYTFFPAAISGNVVWGNGNGGIIVGCCANDKSQVTGNFVNGNTGNGIVVSFSAAGSSIGNNHVLSNSGDGIDIGAPGAVISGNIANANGGDGMSLTSSGQTPPLKATGNTANDNSGLGISFGSSDTDGGSNKAHDNGSAHQCESIVCS